MSTKLIGLAVLGLMLAGCVTNLSYFPDELPNGWNYDGDKTRAANPMVEDFPQPDAKIERRLATPTGNLAIVVFEYEDSSEAVLQAIDYGCDTDDLSRMLYTDKAIIMIAQQFPDQLPESLQLRGLVADSADATVIC